MNMTELLDRPTSLSKPKSNLHHSHAGTTLQSNGIKKGMSRLGHNLILLFRDIWRSLIFLVVMGVTTGAVWGAPHSFDRLFPVTFFSTSGDIVWTQFAYPYQKPIFSSLAAALIAIIIPVAVILIASFWTRSFCDTAYGILGLSYSLVTGTFIVVVLKKTIGGLRPHFLSVCQPEIPQETIGAGFQNVMFTIEQVCTGTDKAKIGNAIESFPSGHSEISFAGLFYLSIYLFTHLKIQSRYRAGYWRMMACVLPCLLSTYLASTLVLTYNHHGYDVVFGSLIGIVVALMGYRMVFKSLLDKTLNASPACHSEHGKEEATLPR